MTRPSHFTSCNIRFVIYKIAIDQRTSLTHCDNYMRQGIRHSKALRTCKGPLTPQGLKLSRTKLCLPRRGL